MRKRRAAPSASPAAAPGDEAAQSATAPVFAEEPSSVLKVPPVLPFWLSFFLFPVMPLAFMVVPLRILAPIGSYYNGVADGSKLSTKPIALPATTASVICRGSEPSLILAAVVGPPQGSEDFVDGEALARGRATRCRRPR